MPHRCLQLAQPRLFALVLGLLVLAMAMPGAANVPHERAVPAYAEEQTILQLEQGLRAPGLLSQQSGIQHFDRHFITPPGRMTEQDVILQRGGNTWRTLRNGPFAVASAVLLLGVPLLIFAFYRVVGPSDPGGPETGRRLVRFTRAQRLTHWATAITFVVLALTGLLIMYGKQVLLPWMGPWLFSWFAIVSKYVHNIAGPLFVLLTIAMFLLYLAGNRFVRADWTWLRKGGGMVTHEHVPAGRFNAGQKIFFWLAVVVLGVLVGISGLLLDFPYFGQVGEPVGTTRYVLQIANFVHIASAVLYMAIIMGHAYLGSLGTPGAWNAMVTGEVDESRARSHHSLWAEEEARRRGTYATVEHDRAPGSGRGELA